MVKHDPPEKLSDELQRALAAAVASAQSKFDGTTTGVARLINDLYTGRDPASGGPLPETGVAWHELTDPTKVQQWHYPQIGANLFQARTRQLVTELIPAVPSFAVEALVGQATHLVEEQTLMMNWLSQHSNLKQVMRESALNGLLGSHFGVKVEVDHHAPVDKRLRYIAIPSSHCGYEPVLKRFSWHRYQIQWHDLMHKPEIRPGQREPKCWEMVEVTEVYHAGFGSTEYDECPVSFFVTLPNDNSAEQMPVLATDRVEVRQPLGEYVITVEKPTCPLVIDSFLDPAPGEDIPPPEVVSWVPVIRSIHSDLKQIEAEVGQINNIVLYDQDAFDPKQIGRIESNPLGSTLYVPLDTTGDSGLERQNGVAQKMRPVERNSALGELITALQTHMQLLDEVVGASSLDRGVAQNPRKSATEAGALVQANNRRTRDRLNVIADVFSSIARTTFEFQQVAFGTKLQLPMANGLNRNIEIPDPAVARMSFRVDAVELGNLSKQGQVETHAASISLLMNVRQQAPDIVQPGIVIAEVRKYLRALGNHEAADALQPPALSGGPQERIRDYMYGRTSEIPVAPTDDHEAFMAAYQQEILGAASNPSSDFPVDAISRAMQEHSLLASQNPPAQPEAQAPVPGFGPGGQPDNQAAAALQQGGVPIDQIGDLALNQIR